MINHNPNVGGFSIVSIIYKTAAYADNLLFFVTNPHISIPNLVKEFQYYGYVSNMKMNYSKSEALNLTLSSASLTMARSTCSFKWETTALKYLGIRPTPTVADIYQANFKHLLDNIQQDLKHWSQRPISWFGRKQYLKWLYSLEYFIIFIPYQSRFLKKKCKQLHSIIRSFI